MKKGLQTGVVILLTMIVSVLMVNFYMAFFKDERPLPKVVVKKVNYSLLPYIKEAQILLAKEQAGFTLREIQKWRYKEATILKKKGKTKMKVKKEKIFWTEKELGEYNILLAVMSLKSKKIEVAKLTPRGVENSNFMITLGNQTNGVNTDYRVKGPEGDYLVLANRRVVKQEEGYAEAVYTAYSPMLNTSPLRKAGLEYLKKNLETAKSELRTQGVRSQAFSGLVADTTPTDVAMVLSVIEHIDPARMENTPIDQLVSEVLVVVGANQENAYKYAISSAKARGLFQFIERTYNAINERYPTAGLKVNFVHGMDNHLNAAKASLLLFDSDLSVMSKDQRLVMANNLHIMGRYLAAAYNGGASRANRAMKKHGSNWTNKMLPETVMYLKKYDAVKPVLS